MGRVMTLTFSHNGPTRRDAIVRRKALLDAAIECFEAHGYSVPLEEIADRAGVGRGTLYRNFKDRIALALAIFEREIERLSDIADLNLPFEQALRQMVLQGARMSALFARLAAEVQVTDSHIAAFNQLGLRAQQAMEPLARRAHAERQLRDDIGAAEILIVVRMLGGLCKPFKDEAEIEAQFDAGLAMLLAGIAPR
jgi:AcrR family transcriptional regulator